MGWTIDGRAPKTPQLAEKLFSTLGRALYVATSFERKCAFILQIVTVSERAANREVSGMSFEDIFAPVNDGSTVLGRTLHGLQTQVQMKGILPLLHQGRIARNHIAHDVAAELGPLGNIGATNVDAALIQLRPHVESLASADAAICRIVYWIEEKGAPLPGWLDKNYARRLVEWVFDGKAGRLKEDRATFELELRAKLSAKSEEGSR